MTKTIDEILTKVLFVGSDNGKPNEWGWQVINEAKASILALIKEAEPIYNSKTSRNYLSVHPNNSKAHKNGYRLGVREYTSNLRELFNKEEKS